MTTQTAVFHALLRPAILQILRATGYHSAKPSVVDSVTDIAARYLSVLCESTASHAIHNHGDAGDYTITDVRMALHDAGAFQPEKVATEEAWLGEEDVGGVEEFIEWFSGQRMRELMDIGIGDGESDATDYLNALKKKHSKTGEDTKYSGTVVGKPLDSVVEIQVEGGPVTSISEWIQQRSACSSSAARTNGTRGHECGSPTPSSGLSSVGSRLDDDGDEGMGLS
ncbi:uncharacterized protein UV8b_02538 [Ustilaginoidea virens]|uniref:Bromodomain associated domain-containing protein n=1 Tax=Ustilaginoidea virens TaxID=1159556 RepID=A0A8E5HN00_USTVR|nr:uncharacterized protein UV8b_02538 [Ustilaginoidea virens]QUC18297.1 hypothetical protein UV8b_02538 [Ustilaginoidea virens]